MLTVRRTLATISMALVLAFSAGLIASSQAFAASADATMGLAALQDKLEASPSNSLPGYFRTVMHGSKIDTISCTILAITGNATPDTALILFKSADTAITDVGGIAEGMSGSPIYYVDEGTPKIVGAVSYGDEFTVGGTGLATPIEAMLEIRHNYSPQIQPLAHPIMTAGGLIDRVIVAPNPEAFAGAAQEGALVAKPLASLFVSGLRSDSKVFIDLKSELAAKGLGVSARTTPGTGTSTLDTDLVPGAAISALASRGDMWIGSIGTVTYADGDDVLAYGHPAHWLGESDEFMCNAYIDGVWPSQDVPYKLGRPAALKGTITQDRTAGIMGQLDTFPAETTITVHAVNADTGKSADSAVYFPRSFVTEGLLGPSAFMAATYVAGSELFDAAYNSGSAEITTTVDFGDGTHHYEVVLPDTIDSDGELPDAVTGTTGKVISALDDAVTADGYAIDIESVKVQVAFSKERRGASIISVDAPDGLKIGANRVVVQLYPYTDDATQTIETTLMIPAGMPLTGVLLADSASDVNNYGDTIDAVYKSLSDWSPSSKLWVAYSAAYDYEDDYYVVSSETSVSTAWALQDYASANVTTIRATASPATVAYGRSARITGVVVSSPYSIPDEATVYITDAGQSSERLLGTFAVTYNGGGGSFSFSTGPLTSNARIRIHTDATASEYGQEPGSMSANGYIQVKVAAVVSMATSAKSVKTGRTVKLTTRVSPTAAAGGSVTFEYYDAGHKSWRKIATKTLGNPSGGSVSATTNWKVVKGTHKVRARYLGGTRNASTSSAAVQIKGT